MKVNILKNPVLKREMRTKMRSWRAAGIIVVYLGIMISLALTMLSSMNVTSYNYYGISPDASINMFCSLAAMELALILFIVPAITAGTISGEREKQTLDLLLTTTMTPMEIIVGKLSASLSHVILLLIASLPVFSIVFMFGGVSALQMAGLMLYFVFISIMVGSVALYFSSRTKKTTSATVLTYATGIFMILGTLWITLILVEFSNGISFDEMMPLNYINPVIGFISFIDILVGMGMGSIPGVVDISLGGIVLKPWLINMVFNIGFSFILLKSAAKNLTREKNKK